MPPLAWRVVPLVAVLILGYAAAQHSEPLVHDSQATKGGNKFKTRNVEDIEKHIFGTHANEFDPTTACPHRHVPPNVHRKFMAGMIMLHLGWRGCG